MSLAAAKRRERSRNERRWRLLAQSLICEVALQPSARFFSKQPAMSKPIIPDRGAPHGDPVVQGSRPADYLLVPTGRPCSLAFRSRSRVLSDAGHASRHCGLCHDVICAFQSLHVRHPKVTRRGRLPSVTKAITRFSHPTIRCARLGSHVDVLTDGQPFTSMRAGRPARSIRKLAWFAYAGPGPASIALRRSGERFLSLFLQVSCGALGAPITSSIAV